MNTRYAIVIILVGVALPTIVVKANILQQQHIFAQPSSSPIHIIKDGTNSYTISSGSSKVGTFDTSYTIMGSLDSIKASKDLLSSTIIQDYGNSPTIGYVKVATAVSPGANPFADIVTINQTITSEIDKAIESVGKSDFADTTIKCNFGMELSEWSRISHGLLG
jgi:hypothetical protein